LQPDLESMIATVGLLKDRQDILDCIQRECRARDRQDEAQILSCWWDDGVDEHGSVISRIPDYAARANMGHKMYFNMTSHNITNHLCEIKGGTAHCETYVLGGLFWQDNERTTMAFGRYLDRMVRRNGEWRLHTRKCTIEMSADADGSWVFSDNVKGFLKARWDGQDPSDNRPFVAGIDGLRW
jgi:SnoaL-like domain